MILCVVGSGGKTTLIKTLAKQYREEKKTVFVTTSTHMFIEEDTLLTDDAELIIQHNEVFGACGSIPCPFLHSAMVEDILAQPFLSHRSISHNDRRQL